jgi:predicted choloylglycine hydrolase
MKVEQLNVSVTCLKGSAFEIGVIQGEEIKTTHLVKQLDFLEKLTTNTNPVITKERLMEIAPHFLEELTGIAKGLNLQLDTIINLYSGYDVDFPSMGCTTFIQQDYYVRNYDFSPEIYDARLVFSNPSEGYASVGFSQQIVGRLDGMNEKGLVVGLHFVNDEHKGEGFLATTIVRLVLDQCSNIKEAVSLLATIPHGFCYNYSITDSSGESVVVEASPDQQIVHFSTPLSCTNHFEASSLQEKNKKEIQGSIKRKAYIRSNLIGGQSPLTAYHHFNDGDSPLFIKNYDEYFGTLHTVVYLPKELSVIIGIGENCEPIELSLKDYLDGTMIPPKFIKGKIDRRVR